MIKEFVSALKMMIVMTLLTGVIYPGLVTLVAQIGFHSQANGSLIYKNNVAVGSSLIGQSFEEDKYFWGRPSVTSPAPYNASASSGSNFGPSNPDLIKLIGDRAQKLRSADPENTGAIPVDLVTASGSGLDPDISLASAHYQASRIARSRHIHEEVVLKIIDVISQEPQLGFLGEARVNVLRLNLLLDDYEKDPKINLEKPDIDQLPKNMKWGDWQNPRKL